MKQNVSLGVLSVDDETRVSRVLNMQFSALAQLDVMRRIFLLAVAVAVRVLAIIPIHPVSPQYGLFRPSKFEILSNMVIMRISRSEKSIRRAERF